MHTRTVETIEDFLSIKTEWNELLDRSSMSSPFLVHDWIQAWWREYAGEHDLLHVTCYYDDASGALLGVLPTYVQRDSGLLRIRRLRFLSDDLGATSLDCLLNPAAGPAVLEAIVDHVTSGRASWDVLDLRRMDERSPFRARLLERFAESGRRVVSSISVSCPTVDLPAEWEQYLGMLSKRERGRLRRLRRELESLGEVTIEWVDDAEALPQALDDAMCMFEQGMGRKHDDEYAVSDRYRRFLLSVSEAFASQGRLRLLFLRVDGKRIAFVYQMRHRDGMYAYQTAYEESWAPQHVGFVVFGYAIENAIAEACSFFNFGVGVGAYKLRFAPEVVDLHGVRAYRSSLRGTVARARDATLAWGKKTAKRVIPRGVSERLATAVSRRGLDRL